MRTGRTDLATDALDRLATKAQATGTDWALGIEARSRALLSDGDVAEAPFREAIEHLSRTRVRAELARAHLLYGEWLRREGRRARRARPAAHGPRAVHRDGHGGLRRARPPRAAGHRRDRAQAHAETRDELTAAGSADRPARPRRSVEPGDRRPAVPESAHRRMASAQGVRQARHQLAPAAPRCARLWRARRAAGPQRRRPTASRYSCSKRAGSPLPRFHSSQKRSSAATSSASRPVRRAFASTAIVGP